MGSWVVLSLLALLSPGIHGASLPYHVGYDWHFNQMGVHVDLALKDQTNPLVGGKAHVELPISTVWKLIEGENQLMKTLVIALEKTTLGKLYDIQTVKADLNYNAEKVLEGIYNVAIDYTLVHKDGTEEKATVLLQGKKESGMLVTSLEVITKKLEDTSRQIILPLQITLSCSWPNAHAITINGSFGKILINIANDLNEVSARGMWEYLGQQYKYSSVLSIKDKYFTLTCQAPNEEPKTLVMKPQIADSLPTLEISGQVPNILWFHAGEINTQLTPFNLFDYEIKHTNGKMDITLKCFTITTQIIIEYSKTMVRLVFPVVYSNKKTLEIELEYQPTNDLTLLDGGNIKMMASLDSMSIIKIGGYCGLTINAANNEVVFNDFYVDVMDGAFKASFSELKLSGKITIDSLTKNGFLPKISVEAKIEKDQKEMFNVLLETVETGYKLRIYYPYLLKNILNIQNLEYVEILHTHVVTGKETTITTICNLTSMKLIAKITSTMISYELMDGEVSLIKYFIQLNKMEVGTNSYLVIGTTNLHLNENSLIYKVLSYVSTSLCFKDWTTNYHLEVVDKGAREVNVQVQVTKDTIEILNVEVNNVQVPTITTICNLTSKKFIAKITPTMISYELLDGEVSLIKFLNKLTMAVGTNSYLVKGTTNLHLNENSFIYKVLSYVSTSLCFKDFATNYHLEVVDKAAKQVNVHVQVTKDTHEILDVEVTNVQVPKITMIFNLSSKKLLAKITPGLISFELLDGKVSVIKYLNQFTMEIGTNSYLVKGTANISLNENSFIYKVLSYVSTSLCFKDFTTNYHLEVVDKAARKVNVQVHVTKDTLEILDVEVTNVQVPKITMIFNFFSMKFLAKITPTIITYELFDGELSLIKYVNQLNKMEVGTNSYIVEGKSNIHLNENSYLYKVQCYVSNSICFKDFTTNYHLEVVDNTVGKVNVQVHVTKDTLDILHAEVNNMQVPYKITLKAPVLPFEIIVDYELSTKEWTVMINKISLLKVKPTIGNLYEVHVYEVPLVQVALLKKQFKISTITKDVPAITAIITWKTLSIFENSVGIQVLYKQIVHKTLFGWNINQLKKAFVDIMVTGSGTPLLGDYKLFHHLNWYITDIMNVDFEWNGKLLLTGLAFLNKPLVTDGKLKINNYVIDMELVEKYKNEPYTVILKTKPMKIALLPFFEYP